jgi:hypothetical protein
VLERCFEGFLALRQTLEQNVEEERRERTETIRQLQAMAETVRGISACTSRNNKVTKGHNSPGQQNDGRICEERWWQLKIPVFYGDDTCGWTNCVETYFELKEMNDNEKLQTVMVALEGKALTWYKWGELCAINPTWEAFKSAAIRMFQSSMLPSPFELLLSLKQTGTVEEHREQFELYAGPLKCTEPVYLKRLFLNGLKEVIRGELKLHSLEGLYEMMDYAQRIDQKSILLNNRNVGLSSIVDVMKNLVQTMCIATNNYKYWSWRRVTKMKKGKRNL